MGTLYDELKQEIKDEMIKKTDDKEIVPQEEELKQETKEVRFKNNWKGMIITDSVAFIVAMVYWIVNKAINISGNMLTLESYFGKQTTMVNGIITAIGALMMGLCLWSVTMEIVNMTWLAMPFTRPILDKYIKDSVKEYKDRDIKEYIIVMTGKLFLIYALSFAATSSKSILAFLISIIAR